MIRILSGADLKRVLTMQDCIEAMKHGFTALYNGEWRIAELSTMQTEVATWEKNRNNMSKVLDWQFTTDDARIRLKRLYPKL